jgi:hypothetical protein
LKNSNWVLRGLSHEITAIICVAMREMVIMPILMTLENLWGCEEHIEHHAVHTSLLSTVDPLIKAGHLAFKKGKHCINEEKKEI